MENLPSSIILFIILIFACVVSFTLAVLFCCRLDSRTAAAATTTTARNTINTLAIENIIFDDVEIYDTIGLEPTIIETFPIIPYQTVKKLKKVKGRHGCVVCLSEFENYDALCILPGCCHAFHPSCIEAWLVSHVTCPICRSNLSDPAVLASDHCLIGGEQDVVMTDVKEMGSSGRFIGRSMSLAGRWSGRSGRWDALIKTLSDRWRKEDESKRIVPTFTDSVDERELDMGSSNSRENNIV